MLSNFPRLSNVEFFPPSPESDAKTHANPRSHRNIWRVIKISSYEKFKVSSKIVPSLSISSNDVWKMIVAKWSWLFIIPFFFFYNRSKTFERSPISRTIQFNRRKSAIGLIEAIRQDYKYEDLCQRLGCRQAVCVRLDRRMPPLSDESTGGLGILVPIKGASIAIWASSYTRHARGRSSRKKLLRSNSIRSSCSLALYLWSTSRS